MASSISIRQSAASKAQVRRGSLFILQQLVSKDFKIKYRRSVLGIAWSVLNPLLMMCVLTLVFSNMFRFDIPNYPVYLILGMTLFTLMSESTQNGMASILDAAPLLKKVRLEKAIFPIEKVAFSLLNYLLNFCAAICVMIFFGIKPSWCMLALPLLLVYVVVFCAGLSLLLSALAVFFRDVMHLWSVVITAWNYLTPIFWPETMLQSLDSGLSHALIVAEQFNPMYHFVGYIRNIMMYQTMPGLQENLICLTFAVVTFAVGLTVFRRKQSKFVLYI